MELIKEKQATLGPYARDREAHVMGRTEPERGLLNLDLNQIYR